MTQAGVCDWTVSFVDPPAHAHVLPIDYRLVVANVGSAPCEEAPLTITSRPHIGSLAIDTTPVDIPPLAPQQSYTASFAVNADPGPGFLNFLIRSSETPTVGFDATMPLDADGPTSDETDHASTKLLPEVATFEEEKHAYIDTDCPRDVTTGGCAFDAFIVIFAANNRGPSAVGHMAVTRRPIVVGSVHGTIKRGKKGRLHYTLNKTGRRRLRAAHKLRVTLIGTREQGVKRTLVTGHVILR